MDGQERRMNELSTRRRAGRPSAEEAEQKRVGLLDAALEDFARVGFHAASLRDIAERAQVSSRTLYNYFPDKLALFEACLEYSGRQIQPVLADLKGDLHAQLVTYATEMQRQLFKSPNLQIARLIYRESGEFDELREIARIQFERYQVTPVVNILARDNVQTQDRRRFAAQFVALALSEWQRRLLLGGAAMTDDELIEHAELATGIFLKGICPGE